MNKIVAGIVAGAAVTTAAVIGATPASAHAVPSCKGSQLAVSRGPSEGATGHANVILKFRNTSKATCSLRGYPGLDAVGPHGGTLAHAKRTRTGFTGGSKVIRTVVLKPHALASADVEWQNFANNGGDCRFSHSIATTPANTAKTVHFPISVSLCDLQVHPTVAGGSGNG